MADEKLQVHGALIQGYAEACMNLNIIAGSRVQSYIDEINSNNWYPLSTWAELEKSVVDSYANSDPIMLRVGMEMMNAWYYFGAGKDLISSGLDFLNFQTGSQGIVSVVKGHQDLVGEFKLQSIDEKNGRAKVISTTPFNRKMECGVLIGGMLAPGDLDYVDVVNDSNPNCLEIEFH